MYEVLLDMEDLERNSAQEIHQKDHTPDMILKFCSKLKSDIEEMDWELPFSDNLIEFCADLEPVEEEILFYDIVVPFYEVWQATSTDPDFMDDEEDRLEADSLVAAGKIIIDILDDYLGFDYLNNSDNQNL